MSKLMDKYNKLEKAANRIAASPYSSDQDRKEAWAEANAVWEKIKATKKKLRVR